jgi:hypothetical protein
MNDSNHMMISPVESSSIIASIAVPVDVVSKTPVASPPTTSALSVRDKASLGSSHSYSKKRGREDTDTHDNYRKERKAANRLAAYQSRLRKKQLIEELKGKVSQLTNKLANLHDDNKSLSHRLEIALEENRRLRFSQQETVVLGGRVGMKIPTRLQFAQQEPIMLGGGVGMNMSTLLSHARGLGLSGDSLSALLASKVLGGGYGPSVFPFRR